MGTSPQLSPEERWAVFLSVVLLVRNGLLIRRGGGITPRSLLCIETVGFGLTTLAGLAGRRMSGRGLRYRVFQAAALLHLFRLALYATSRRVAVHPPANATVTNKG
jgi:hypothetical protein